MYWSAAASIATERLRTTFAGDRYGGTGCYPFIGRTFQAIFGG